MDVPFADLTFFFVKASLAAALALGLTSVVWLGLLAMFGGIGAGVYLAMDAARVPAAPVYVSSGSVAAVLATPPPAAAPAEEAIPSEPIISSRVAPRRADPTQSDAATDALIRAEILRMRARRR